MSLQAVFYIEILYYQKLLSGIIIELACISVNYALVRKSIEHHASTFPVDAKVFIIGYKSGYADQSVSL